MYFAPSKKRGFTLVELLVVVTIISILSVVGISIFSGTRQSANDARKKADVNEIAKAAEVNYNLAAGGYTLPQDSWFVSGKVPTPPEGGTYSFSLNADSSGFQICAPIGGSTGCSSPPSPSASCFCRQSRQGEYIAGGSPPPTSPPPTIPPPTSPPPTIPPAGIIFHLAFNNTLNSTDGDVATWAGRTDTGTQATYLNSLGKLVNIATAGEMRYSRVIDPVNNKAPAGAYAITIEGSPTSNNQQLNSSFESGAPPSNWTADGGLTVTQSSTFSIHKTFSARLVTGGSNARYYQSRACNGFDAAGVYARNDAGSAITSADIDLLIRNDASVTGVNAVFTQVTSDGWYRLASRGALSGTCNYGVVVKAGKTIYIDAYEQEAPSGQNLVGMYKESTSGTTTVGGDGRLTYSTTNNFNTTVGSISLWFQNWDLNTRVHLFGEQGGRWKLYFDGNGRPNFTPNNGTNLITSGIGITNYSGVWHHIVATWDSSIMRLYFDGVETASGLSPASFPAIGASMAICSFNDGSGSPTANFCNGHLADFAIFNKALSAPEVSTIYNSGVPL